MVHISCIRTTIEFIESSRGALHQVCPCDGSWSPGLFSVDEVDSKFPKTLFRGFP